MFVTLERNVCVVSHHDNEKLIFEYVTYHWEIKKSTPLVANCANINNIPTENITKLFSTALKYPL